MEQIKEITLEQAKKILAKDIAYITMKDGEVLIVNGLDHDKFDKKEKENENYMEEPNKINTEDNLHLIQEDTEENERNSKLSNQQYNQYINNQKFIMKNKK